MSTSDKHYIKMRDDLFNGQRVEIGTSEVEVLVKVRGQRGTIVGAKHDTIVPSELLFIVKLDSGRRVAAGFHELHFLDKDAETAEGRAYA